jgi:hypothetical protein
MSEFPHQGEAPAAAQPPPPRYYWSYGSNMSLKRITERTGPITRVGSTPS